MPKDKRSFFERLTGSVEAEEENYEAPAAKKMRIVSSGEKSAKREDWMQEADEGQLTVDVFNTPDAIIIQSAVAGVRPDDLDVSITKDLITIKGSRKTEHEIREENYFYRELYWGKFSRSIVMPEEIDDEKAEATLKNGLLTIKLPKIDRNRVQRLKIRND